MEKFLGIDVGGGSIRGSIIDMRGHLYLDKSIVTNPEIENEDFILQIDSFIQEFVKIENFSAIGIGTPGPIDIDEGIIYSSANFKNLKNTNLISSLKKKNHIPIFFNNDSNCASLGEYYFGDEKKVSRLFVFTLGTGLGGGFVENGKVYNGYKGNGMEVGHITVIPGGAICGCGKKGCAESYFSTTGFLNRYFDLTNKKIPNAKDFFTLIINGDDSARKVLEIAIETFSDCIRSVVQLLNPERIVFLGGISNSYSVFGKILEEKVYSKIFPVLAENLQFTVGKKLAGSFGAASLCFSKESN